MLIHLDDPGLRADDLHCGGRFIRRDCAICHRLHNSHPLFGNSFARHIGNFEGFTLSLILAPEVVGAQRDGREVPALRQFGELLDNGLRVLNQYLGQKPVALVSESFWTARWIAAHSLGLINSFASPPPHTFP